MIRAIFRKSLHGAVLATGMSCALASAFASEWVDAGPSIDGDAKIQMSKRFSNKTGKFSATPESMLDKREFIEGNFIAGTYRNVYNTAEQDKRAVNNPDYKPKMTAEQMDALMDTYAPPGAKK